MRLSFLQPGDLVIAMMAMRCAASGEVLPDDEEFEVICGIDLERFRDIAKTLSSAGELSRDQWMALNNGMLWLVSYPHRKDAVMLSKFGLERDAVARAHMNIRQAFGQGAENFLDLIE
jgi:hypothetical protein